MKRRKFTDERKLELLEISKTMGVNEVARLFDIASATLYSWAQRFNVVIGKRNLAKIKGKK